MSSTAASSTSSSSPSSSSSGGGSVEALQTDYGTTTIADSVVAKIASLAAKEVDGVADLGGGVSNAMGSMVGRIRGSDQHSTAGVGVEVGTTQAAVDIVMQVLYPASIHQVANAVRQNVIDRIESMTGLEVTEVNINVSDLSFPGAEQPEEREPQGRVS